jgi:hypothetical protein
MRIVPPEIVSRPATIRRAVVFPQPDGPTSTMNSPSPIERSSDETASVPSANTLVTSSSTISAMPENVYRSGVVRSTPQGAAGRPHAAPPAV